MGHDVSGVGARGVEGGADRADDVGEVAAKSGYEVRALREDARLLRAADLAVDDVHVAVAPERIQRPLRAHGHAALLAFRGRGSGHPDLAGRLAVRLAGTALREEDGHDDVLARPRGGGEQPRK